MTTANWAALGLPRLDATLVVLTGIRMHTWKLSDGASDHLNLIRGLSALAVAACHFRGLFFIDYQQLRQVNPGVQAVYFATGFGPQAVMVFFVLSGFLVSASVLRHSAETWSPRTYAIHRLTRLYVVLIPALVVTALCDYVSQRLPGGLTYFQQAIPNISNIPFAWRETATAFAGNLVFLQTLYVPQFGSNGPLWSLANEFWYYLLWPLLFITFAPVAVEKRSAAALLAGLTISFVPIFIWYRFPIWLMGCGLHFAPRARALSHPLVKAAATGMTAVQFAAVLAWSRAAPRSLESDFIVAASFAIFLYVLVQAEGARQPGYSRYAGLTAGFSFSMYAIHFPLVLLARTVLWKTGRWEPSFPELFGGLMLLTGILFLTYLFSLATEAQTYRVRKALLSITARKSGFARAPAPSQ